MLFKSQSVCPLQAFPACLKFTSKAGAQLSEAHFMCSTLGQAPSLFHKHQTRLEKPSIHKHPNLKICKLPNCKLYNIDPVPNIIQLLKSKFTSVSKKLECLSQVSLSSLSKVQSKARAQLSEATFRCSRLVQAPGLFGKHWRRLDVPSLNKHPNLL